MCCALDDIHGTAATTGDKTGDAMSDRHAFGSHGFPPLGVRWWPLALRL